MKNKRFIFFFFFTFLIITLLHLTNSQNVYANNGIFQDNFNDGNANGWDEYDGDGNWEVKNETYEGTVTLINYPENSAYSTNGNINWTDYIFEVDVKSIVGVDKVVEFRHRSINERYLLNIVSSWSGGGDIVNLFKLSPKHTDHLHRVSFTNYPNTWYRLRIVVVNTNENTTNIKLYIKDIDHNFDFGLVFEYNDNYHPITNGKIGLFVWPGGYAGLGSITTTQFDNVTVRSLAPVSPNDSVILLPGLGASWNHEAIILDIPKQLQDWYMTPFVKSYDGLIQTLKNAGYEDSGKTQNLFIFNYDWRQPIETTAKQLHEFIENVVTPSQDIKIDLIGHSLGGMVARTYVQNYPDHQIDQLITLGSPHKGAPQVYYLWGGADLKRTLVFGWQRIAAGILLQLKKKDYKNNVETIHHIFPGFKDLLPTFPYLKQYGIEKPLSKMSVRNNWLENFNLPPLPNFLSSVLNSFVGLKGNTLRWINVKNRNRLDHLLGKWIDGKPISEEFEMGDYSVLAESAQLPNTNVFELFGLDHRDLVESTEGIQAIVDFLGLSPTEIIPAPEISYEPSLVFQIASSANLTIFDPHSLVIAEKEKLVFVPNPEEGNYQVLVNPENGGGKYRLIVGKIFSHADIWIEYQGEVMGVSDSYNTFFTASTLVLKKELFELARNELLIAKILAEQTNNFLKNFLIKIIVFRIKQIEEIILLFEKNKDSYTRLKLRYTIYSFISLKKGLPFWEKVFGPLPEIKNHIQLATDYLLQAYELDSSL